MMKKRIVALFTTLGLCMGMTTTAFAVEETGAELLKKADCYITFEDTVEDLNGNYTPTYEGTANYVEGKFGKAANAAGGVSHVAIENMTFGEDSFTIATWMKINNFTGDPALFGNKDWGSGSNPGFLMFPTGGGVSLNANVADGSRTDIGWPYRMYAVENANGLNEWMYVAFVVDRAAGTAAISINGGDLATQSMVYEGVLDDTTNNYPFRIGEEGKGTYNNADFNVDYDEFAIFKEALTLEQIQSLYTYAPEGYEPAVIQTDGGENGSESVKSLEESLIAHYDGIDNAEGGHDAEATVWEDLSGKGNDFEMDETYGWTDKALQVQSKVAGYFPQAVVDVTNTGVFTLEIAFGAYESLADEYDTLIASGNDEFSIFRRIGGDLLEFKYNDSNASRLKITEAADAITDSTLTFVFNSDKCWAKVYVDGVLVDNVLIVELGNIADDLFLGHYSSDRCWNGDVYSIRVYDRPLTEDEVKQNVAEIDAKYRTVATPEPTNEPTKEPTDEPTKEPENNNTVVIVIAVIAVVAIVGGAVYVISKKKNK